MSKDQKTVLQIYGAYITSVIMSFLPLHSVSTFGTILFIVVLIATYFYRARSKENNFIHSHMKFVLKTLWISSLFLLIGMTLSYFLADHSIVHQTYSSIMQGMMLSEEQLNEILMHYFRENIFIFILTLAPSLIYFLYRLAKGGLIAKNNQAITNLNNWF